MTKILHDSGHDHGRFAKLTTRNFPLAPSYHMEHLPDCRLGAKIFAGGAFGNHSRFRLHKERGTVAGDEWKPDDLEEIGTHDVHLVEELPVSRRHCHLPGLKMDGSLDFRQLSGHRIRRGKSRSRRGSGRLAGITPGPFDAIKISRTWYPAVVGKFVAHEQGDEDRASKAHRETRDVDEAVELVTGEVPEGGDEVIAKHDAILRESGGCFR